MKKKRVIKMKNKKINNRVLAIGAGAAMVILALILMAGNMQSIFSTGSLYLAPGERYNHDSDFMLTAAILIFSAALALAMIGKKHDKRNQ